jgi:hypothetical protein
MSQMGHPRRFELAPGTSGLPLIPDTSLQSTNRRAGPTADIAPPSSPRPNRQPAIHHFYIVSDASDYTIPIHAERRGLHHALVEIRQDLIADESGQHAWALRLARVLPRAYQEQ